MYCDAPHVINTQSCKYINCSKKYGILLLSRFCTYFFIIFTWVLHLLKGCSFPYILQKKERIKIDQVRAELQLCKRCGGQSQKLQKLNFLEPELP